ncbi:unknown [Clostridium sp. CAG:465]|nr:unknown [Clostridium sp. CAG:465]
MQITNIEIQNKKYVQFYLTKEELEKDETKNIIEKYKKEKYNVAIFLTGKEDYSEVLKNIIKKQMEANKDV